MRAVAEAFRLYPEFRLTRPDEILTRQQLQPRAKLEMVEFMARGENNALAASRPTLYGQTRPADSIWALTEAVRQMEQVRRFLADALERQSIRSRILEPHRGVPLPNIRSDRA